MTNEELLLEQVLDLQKQLLEERQFRVEEATRSSHPAPDLHARVASVVTEIMAGFKISGEGVSGYGMSWSIKNKQPDAD